jgi:hypothetical protein
MDLRIKKQQLTKTTTYRPLQNKQDSGIDLEGLVQEQHYSPSREVRIGNAWGLAFGAPSPVESGTASRAGGEVPDRFTYNSKELVTDLDLGWNDGVYPDLIGSARMYMSEIGRWNGVDLFVRKRKPINPKRVAAALLPIVFKMSAVNGISNLGQKGKRSSCNNCTKTF